MRFPILAAVIAATAIAVVGQGLQQMSPEQREAAAAARDQAINHGAPPDPAAVARGKTLFQSTCAGCHGAEATGGIGPNLLDVPEVLHDKGGDTLGPFLQHGIPDNGMPAFPSLTTAQVADIAAFLVDRERLAADRFAQERPQVIVGNAAAGKQYFDAHCSTCHSPTGDMAGIGKKYQPAELTGRILTPRSRFRGGPAVQPEVTVTWPSGRSVNGKLVHQDEFYIQLTDAQGWQKTYSAEGAKVQLVKPDPLAAHEALFAQFTQQRTDAHLHDLVAYLESLK